MRRQAVESKHDNVPQRVAAIIDPSLSSRITWPKK
jgi:hypothetical protein